MQNLIEVPFIVNMDIVSGGSACWGGEWKEACWLDKIRAKLLKNRFEDGPELFEYDIAKEQ